MSTHCTFLISNVRLQNSLKVKHILPSCPSISPVTQISRLSSTPPCQLAPELHCFDRLLCNAASRYLALYKHTFSTARTSTLPPSLSHRILHVNPPLRSQLTVNSPGLGAFDCSVARQQLPWKHLFLKGGLGEKKQGTWKEMIKREKKRTRRATKKMTTVAWSPQ